MLKRKRTLNVSESEIDVKRTRNTHRFRRCRSPFLAKRAEGPPDVLGEEEEDDYGWEKIRESRCPDCGSSLSPFTCPISIPQHETGITLPYFGSSLFAFYLACDGPKDRNRKCAEVCLKWFNFEKREWWDNSDFFSYDMPDSNYKGTVEVSHFDEGHDRLVLNVLCRTYSKRDCNTCFHTIPPAQPAKFCMKDGKPVGFYCYTMPDTRYVYGRDHAMDSLVPMMDKIYVRKPWRGEGFGRIMFQDFFQKVCGNLYDRYPFFTISSPIKDCALRCALRSLTDDQLRFIRLVHEGIKTEERLENIKSIMYKKGHYHCSNLKQEAYYRVISGHSWGIGKTNYFGKREVPNGLGFVLHGFDYLPPKSEENSKSESMLEIENKNLKEEEN